MCKQLIMFQCVIIVIVADTLSEDECEEDGTALRHTDGPFSALTTSMWPHDSAIQLSPVSGHGVEVVCNTWGTVSDFCTSKLAKFS